MQSGPRFVLLAAVAWCSGSVPTAAQAPEAPAAVDYAKPASWLCLPGQKNACSVDLNATAISADGSLVVEGWQANPDAPIDCFYVYPTISRDKLPNSDLMTHPDEEDLVVREQFARFGSHCRLYAPIYRQGTIIALIGRAPAADFKLAYNDVRSAWQHYLANWNAGRGVVLIGHSQGSRMLRQLIQEEIDGKPLQQRLVSAILAGSNTTLPQGKDVGGDFKSIPACRSASQTGCFIGYVSFRKGSPPPANSRFGRSPGPGLTVACTNPAALGGGIGVLKPYFAANHRHIVFTATAPLPKPWLRPSEEGIRTPYVTLPGMIVGRCVQDEQGSSYLEISVTRQAGDPRIEDVEGDIYADWKPMADWGLHLIDVNVAIGNLIDVVAEQSRAFLKR
jgi:hypothetical protein